jgi:hypothetical protein
MPEPIRPQPITPTFLISMIAPQNTCHPERSEGPMQFAGAGKIA